MSEADRRSVTQDIHVVVRLSTPPGNEDEAKKLIDQLVESCQANDPGCLSYAWYLNDEENEIYVLERYRDSAAVGNHLRYVGEELARRFNEVAAVNRVELFGNPTQEVTAGLKKYFDGTKVFRHYNGFTK